MNDKDKSPLNHPSMPPVGDEDRWEAIEQLRLDGVISDEVAQEAITAEIAHDELAARRAAKPVLRVIEGGWSRYSNRPDLRPVRNIFRVIRGGRGE